MTLAPVFFSPTISAEIRKRHPTEINVTLTVYGEEQFVHAKVHLRG
jgi:hypothetical protein